MKPIRIIQTPTRSRSLNLILGIVLLLGAVLLFLSLAGYHALDPSWDTSAGIAPSAVAGSAPVRNWIGPFGAYLSDLLLQAFGVTAFCLPLWMVGLGWRWARSRGISLGWLRWIAVAITLAFLPASLDLLPWQQKWLHLLPMQGLVGQLIGGALVARMNPTGASLVAWTLALGGVYVSSAFSLRATRDWVMERSMQAAAWNDRMRNWRADRDDRRAEMEAERDQQREAWRRAGRASAGQGRLDAQLDESFVAGAPPDPSQNTQMPTGAGAGSGMDDEQDMGLGSSRSRWSLNRVVNRVAGNPFGLFHRRQPESRDEIDEVPAFRRARFAEMDLESSPYESAGGSSGQADSAIPVARRESGQGVPAQPVPIRRPSIWERRPTPEPILDPILDPTPEPMQEWALEPERADGAAMAGRPPFANPCDSAPGPLPTAMAPSHLARPNQAWPDANRTDAIRHERMEPAHTAQPIPMPARERAPEDIAAASRASQSTAQPMPVAAQPLPTNRNPVRRNSELASQDIPGPVLPVPPPPPFAMASAAGRISIEGRADSGVRVPPVAPKSLSGFRLPPSSLLHRGEEPLAIREEALREEAKVLVEKCGEFDVRGQVVRINPGPMVTTYEFKPEAGVKYSRVTGLAEDLCLAMRAESILIERMAGQSTVGIQVPNNDRETIHLRDIIESENFLKAKAKLPLAMGKDINGRIVTADLASMPHVLIAGSTGSGKSVAINAMIMSLLYKTTPEQVRLILVDPKRVELGMYEGVPHLFTPIITEPKLAANALRNAVREMERRLKLLASRAVRNIDQYNKLFDGVGGMASLFDDAEEEQPLPYMVIIIDELADLMMLDRANVEESITRLAQMARAVGIHLILATQRPSVDVITGLIKANVPTRISFRLATKVDSRTILDTNGAESLLGRGDMLFLPPGTSRLMRLHAPYVSEKETAAVVDFWKAQGQAEYAQGFLESPKEDRAAGDGAGASGDENDELFDDAVRLVFEFGKASTSLLQRRLRIGYGRAAHLIDMMERDGLVGAADGSRPRELLKSPGWLHEVSVAE